MEGHNAAKLPGGSTGGAADSIKEWKGVEQLSIVMPVYNEAGNIRQVLDRINRNRCGISLKVYIVYDSEKDSTPPVVAKLRGKYGFPIALVRNAYGSGALNAIKTGIRSAKGGAVLFSTADLSDDATDIAKMYKLIEDGYDLVSASRYASGGRHTAKISVKKLLSWFIGATLHSFTGIPTRDVTNGFKMYRKGVLKGIKIESDGGFEYGMELAVKAYAQGARITEVPTTWRDRTSGESRFRLTEWGPRYFRWYIYALTHRPKHS